MLEVGGVQGREGIKGRKKLGQTVNSIIKKIYLKMIKIVNFLLYIFYGKNKNPTDCLLYSPYAVFYHQVPFIPFR